MSTAEPLAESFNVISEGLDHVFTHGARESEQEGSSEAAHSSEANFDLATGLSVAQAAVLTGFDQNYVIKLIRQGKLCGARDKTTHKWLVDLECVQGWIQKLGLGAGSEEGERESKADHEPANNEIALPSHLDENDSVRTLWYKLDLAFQQLKAASYRVGYLESQVEQYKQQVKLLPDLEANARRTESAEKEADELRKQLAEANSQLSDFRRPWWKRWLSPSGPAPQS